MSSGFPSLSHAREMLACRLCRRITLLVCLSILAVEVVFLLPSYVHRQQWLYDDQEMEVLLAARTALGWYEKHAPAEILQQSWPSFQEANVLSLALYARSERRRVGKECVSTCRSRWSPYN